MISECILKKDESVHEISYYFKKYNDNYITYVIIYSLHASDKNIYVQLCDYY